MSDYMSVLPPACIENPTSMNLFLMDPTLEQLQKLSPEAAQQAVSLMDEMDYRDPMKLIEVGSEALKSQAEVAMKLVSALQEGPSQEALESVALFEKKLRDGIKPIQARLNTRAKRGVVGRMVNHAAEKWEIVAKAVLAVKKKTQSQDMKTAIGQLSQDDRALVKIINDTIKNAQHLKGLLAQAAHVPELMNKTVATLQVTDKKAAEQLFIALVAVTEYSKHLNREGRAGDKNLVDVDDDSKKSKKIAADLLEKKGTDLRTAILSTCLRNVSATEISKMTADQALEMRRIESIVLPQMVSALVPLVLQQRSSEIALTSRFGNQVLGQATRATTDGLGIVLQQQQEAETARLDTAGIYIQETEKMIAVIEKHRANDRQKAEIEKQLQQDLTRATGLLQKDLAFGGPCRRIVPQNNKLDVKAL